MTDVTRTEFQRDRDLEAECMMLEADSLSEARVQYEEECHPYLESLHKRSARLIYDRAALNNMTGMVATIYRGLPFGYEFTDKTREDLRSLIDDEWQDPATGFWGVTNWEEGACVFHPDISITFHIANYRARQPMPYPEIEKSAQHSTGYASARFLHFFSFFSDLTNSPLLRINTPR